MLPAVLVVASTDTPPALPVMRQAPSPEAAVKNDRLHRLFPFLNWPRPSRETLLGEFSAGMTVGLMLLPQGVTYAALAGMPLVTGIYASIVPAVVAVLWSSSTRLGVGPTALSSLLIGASLSGLAEPASDTWVALAVWLALMSGGLQLLLGLGRFGWLLNLVSSPVLSGFTQAAAWLILASQMRALTGLAPDSSDWLALSQHDLLSLGFGVGSLAALLLAKRFVPRWPAAMIIVVGALPSGLPHLYWPGGLPMNAFGQLVMPALVITLISFLETASSAKVENQRGGTQWNENQDLIGQGLAKIASGLSGSFPISASFSRSAINLYAGAKTGWATLFSVLL